MHFGKLMCSYEDTCHIGGEFYGMGKIGIDVTNKFFKKNPEVHRQKEIFSRKHLKRSFNLMENEKFIASYAFKMVNKVPSIMQMEIYQGTLHLEGIGTEEDLPICYHSLQTHITYLILINNFSAPTLENYDHTLNLKDFYKEKRRDQIGRYIGIFKAYEK